MGYNTTYTLVVASKACNPIQPDLSEEVIAELIKNHEQAGWYLEATGESTYGEGSWRMHEEDLRSFSKAHPDFLFELRGSGAEQGDLWKKYFLGGKMQEARAKMSIAPFDPKELR